MASRNGKPWCVEPFATLESKVWGEWGLCCRSKAIGYKNKNMSPLEHFNSEEMKRIRKDMSNHNITDEIKHLCSKCILHEKNGVSSRRLGMKHVPIPEMEPDGSIKNYKFRTLEIKFFGNLCNLKCRMCGPLYSSSIAAEKKKSGEWDGPVHHDTWEEYGDGERYKFFKDMAEVLPNTLEVKFTGGEPMMNRSILEFVEWMVMSGLSEKLQLRVITNGTVINEDFLNYTKHFKHFHVNMSVDGVFDVDEYQRIGTDFEKIDTNIGVFKKYGTVSFTTAITAINVSRLNEIRIYADSKNVPYDMTSIVTYPSHLQVKVLPPEYRKKLLKTHYYNHVVADALRDDEWPKEDWEKFKQECPDIFDLIPELQEYETI